MTNNVAQGNNERTAVHNPSSEQAPKSFDPLSWSRRAIQDDKRYVSIRSGGLVDRSPDHNKQVTV